MNYEKGKTVYYIKTYGINGCTYDGEVSKAKVVKKPFVEKKNSVKK